jgi:hypothetical protein
MGEQVESPSSETYEAPILRTLGTVQELTLATGPTGNLDDDYPAGTPGPNLFS